MSATNEEINDALVESGIIPTLSDEDLDKIALHPDWVFLRGPLIEYMLSTNKLDALKQVGEKITPNIQNSVLKSIAQSNSFTPESIDAATGIFKKIIQKRFFEFLNELGWTLKYKQPYADAIIEKLAEGDEVAILGFGSFKVAERSARTARNPQTGEMVEVPASKAVTFKLSKSLKEKLN